MYKIYINENRLILCDTKNLATIKKKFPEAKSFEYLGRTKMLFNYIDRLEKSKSGSTSIILHFHDYQKITYDFKSLYEREIAAGGLVINKKGQLLILYRREMLDLPKGKIEKGEGRKEAAVREVMEETGLRKLSVGKKIHKSRHTYRNRKNKRVRKITHWYMMKAKDFKLVPQIEEDIEWAQWMYITDIIESDIPIYKNIIDVIKAHCAQ